ncbi:MAG: RNA 2',3'-cyclic phosphodiesterase [Patescibacteria group bacterium]|nr:RNA 2',3'-cyclic phosphodiesterase [Patescibacteria group bacterium]
MRHRLFIAINLPEKVKNKLNGYSLKYQELPARWTKKQNIHITLLFLGYVQEDEISEILKNTEQVVKNHNFFSLTLNKICYGPPKKTPRMIWAVGEISEQLGELRADLENSLSNLSFKKEKRAYSPHITLARLRQWEFRNIEPEERLQIEQGINLSFEVNSIEIMESQLKRTDAEYSVMQSFPLKP